MLDFTLLPPIFSGFLLLCEIITGVYLFLHKEVMSRKKMASIFSLVGVWILLLCGVVTVVLYIVSIPKISQSYPALNQNWDTYSKPVEVHFNVPVVVSELNPKINPNIQGKWVWDSFLGMHWLTMGGKFYPADTLFANQKVVVYIIGVSRAFYTENNEMGISFDSPGEQTVAKITPQDASSSVTNDQNIVLSLSGDNAHTSQFLFSLNPPLDVTPSYPDPHTIVLKHTVSFTQDTTYTLTIQRRPTTYDLAKQVVTSYGSIDMTKTIHFRTVKNPLIANFSPVGDGVKTDQKIAVTFSIPMNKDSVTKNMKISPAIPGTMQWASDTSFTYTPTNPLAKETTYTITFPKGIVSLQGGTMEKDISFQFSTIGKVGVASVSPLDKSQGEGLNTHVSLTFNQEVDHTSAQGHFQITPSVAGTFSWSGNTMTFTPTSGFVYQTTYTVSLSAGIKSLYGLDSVSTFSSTFTTQMEQVLISGIPNRYQPQPSDSCNIYALLMILNWKGYNNLTASNIIGEMGNDVSQTNGIWNGDPYTEYVGNSDGSWGYGVYWGPTQKVLNNRGISNTLNLNWNLAAAAHAVAQGHPVIIWRYNGESANYNKSWTAADGTYVYAINGQHGGVITGFRGDVNNPTQIYLEDPWYGPGWYDASTFDYYWSRMNRPGLVIN